MVCPVPWRLVGALVYSSSSHGGVAFLSLRLSGVLTCVQGMLLLGSRFWGKGWVKRHGMNNFFGRKGKCRMGGMGGRSVGRLCKRVEQNTEWTMRECNIIIYFLIIIKNNKY